jgi:hypothetical protein
MSSSRVVEVVIVIEVAAVPISSILSSYSRTSRGIPAIESVFVVERVIVIKRIPIVEQFQFIDFIFVVIKIMLSP